jgi:hypothetical protein
MSKVGAASLVGVPAIFNGAGRVLWGWLSDLPSTAGQFFGVRFAGAIYGLVLVAWSLGGIVGPLLISKLIGENRQYTLGFTVIGIIALVALVVPLITRKPADRSAVSTVWPLPSRRAAAAAVHLQLCEQVPGRGRHGVHCLLEGGGVVRGGLAEPADLADVLQGGRPHVVVADVLGVGLTEGLDAATHGRSLSAAARAAIRSCG